MKNKFLITSLLCFYSPGIAYSAPLAVKSTVVKFSFAMGGVILSSLIIYFGLIMYNKIREELNLNISSEDEILRTPRTKEDAINFYIKKNKL